MDESPGMQAKLHAMTPSPVLATEGAEKNRNRTGSVNTTFRRGSQDKSQTISTHAIRCELDAFLKQNPNASINEFESIQT